MSSTVNFQRFRVTTRVTGEATVDAVTPLSAAHAAYVTRIAWSFDDSGVAVVDVTDNSGTAQILCRVNVNETTPERGVLELTDDGMAGGVKVATGKKVQVAVSGVTGTLNGFVYIEGYQRCLSPASNSEF